ncbi:hypothetical protein OAP63_17765 [Vibrio sp.]|nr:hypothetical protein [Vibrio sp.]
MLTDTQIEKLEEQLDNEKIIYSWEAVSPAIGGRNGPLGRIIMALSPWVVMLIFIVLCFTMKEFYKYYAIMGLIISGLFISFLIYFLQFADNYHEYKLTRIGIIQTSKQIIPKGVYTFFRGFAWFGMAICIIAVILVGPLALVGAGAFGLMSFGMTNLSPSVHIRKSVYDDRMILAYVKEDRNIKLRSNPFKYSSFMNIFFKENEFDLIVEKLKITISNCDYMEFNTSSEFQNSEVYKSADVE